MKLATALSERSDLQKRLSEIGIRLNNNSKVQSPPWQESSKNPYPAARTRRRAAAPFA